MLYKIGNKSQFLTTLLTFSSITLVCVWPITLDIAVYKKASIEQQRQSLFNFIFNNNDVEANAELLRLSQDAAADESINSIFCLSQFKADFIDAMYHCRSMKMQLVSIEDYDKEQTLFRFMDKECKKDNGDGDGDGVWTSGNDVKSERRFIWEATGHDFTYFNYEFLTHINWIVDDTNNCVSIQHSSSASTSANVNCSDIAGTETEAEDVPKSARQRQRHSDYYWKETSCWEPLYFVCQKV